MKLNIEGAIQHAHERLRAELPTTLYYHSLAHTRDDVLPAAERFATLSAVSGLRLQLLRVAAWYHDIGFVHQRSDHETIGAQIASESLPLFGFQAQHIRQIVGMIQATKLPQTPHTLLEQLLADADLDVLGRDDFSVRNQALRAELAHVGTTFADIQWYGQQYAFLHRHQYWTHAAREVRDLGKQHNLAYLAQLLADA